MTALAVCICVATTCSTPPPPSEEAVEQAWKRSDDAVKQSVSAHDEVKHIARLREIDRMRYQADVSDLTSQLDTVRTVCVGLMLVMLAAIVWLAVEIRRRRIITAVVGHQIERGSAANSRP